MSRFDRIILLFLLTVALLTGFVIWRGDQVALLVTATYPLPAADAVSTGAAIRVEFDAPLRDAPPQAIRVEPAVAGDIQISGNALIFEPAAPLAPENVYRVTLASGIVSLEGHTLDEPYSWEFRTTQPRILYIGWEGESTSQIFVADVDGGEPAPLTQAPADVLDFAVSPDGAQVVYSVYRNTTGTDLWIMRGSGQNQRQLLACADAACSAPVWSPDGQRIIYERRNIPTPGAPPGPPRLWWLDVTTGETVPVFADSQLLGLGAQFSSDGAHLSYVSPADQAIQVYNLEDGSGILIPSQMGSPGVWRPNDKQLVFTNIQLTDDQWSVHLLTVDTETEAVLSLSGEGNAEVDDSTPAWSPDGEWLAFGRKQPRTPMGRQLWLMRADGSQTHALTDDPDVHHGPFAWSPDGRFLLIQQYNLSELYAQPTIWLLNVETNEKRQIANPGSQPVAWLP